MSRASERDWLEADLAAVERMLHTLPEDDVLNRVTLESRVASIRSDLQRFSLPEVQAHAEVVFSGAPVLRAEAILAEFAASALGNFQRLVAALVGKRVDTDGRVLPAPELLVAGVVHGSFGFELRERSANLLATSEVATAIDQAQFLLAAASESDEAFDDGIAPRDRRVATALRDFLEATEKYGASVRLSSDATIALTAEQVRHAARRAKATDIDEDEMRVRGVLFLLPNARQFELQTDDGVTIKGRLGERVNEEKLRPLVGKSCVARIRTIYARHPGRRDTRHVLLGTT